MYLGRNGSGKTTAFKAALGLINAEGHVETLGKSPAELTEADRREIGVVMADSGFSAYMKPAMAAKIMKELYDNFDEADFLAKCRQAGLDADKKIKDFSRGMQAKFKMLCALSHSPRLLILDEPTSGLDVVARGELLDALREYMDDERGILISSHIASDLESLCDDIYLIDNGKIVLHEDTDRLLGSYGVIKATAEQYEKLDKAGLMRVKKEPFGFSCLTDSRESYIRQYPDLVIDNGGIDSVLSLMTKGEKI